MFQKIGTSKSLVVGSIVSETGSEYLFGYDPTVGLKWLERKGVQYDARDAEWVEAQKFLETHAAPGVPAPDARMEQERPAAITRNIQTVQSSPVGEGAWEDPYPMEGDPRIVGDLDTGGKDIPDDDISAQAEMFLTENAEGF